MAPDLRRSPPCSPKLSLGGVVGLPRLLEKARAAAAHQLGDYVFGPESPLDRGLCEFLGLGAEEVSQRAAADASDAELLDWIQRAGTRRTTAEIGRWSHRRMKLLARDDPDRTDYIQQVLQQTGLPPDTTTTLDWLEFDDRQSFGRTRTIAVIGAGQVGSALGCVWARTGHEVLCGVRDVTDAKYDALRQRGGRYAQVMPLPAAFAAANVVVVATPWAATRAALESVAPWSGKILIDCTNPLRFTPGRGLELLPSDTPGAEQMAAWAPGAAVIKCFNTYGWENLAEPPLPGPADARPVMFYCGDDAPAKAIAAELSSALGFEPFDAGALHMARDLEPLAHLWISSARTKGANAHFTWSVLRGRLSQ